MARKQLSRQEMRQLQIRALIVVLIMVAGTWLYLAAGR